MQRAVVYCRISKDTKKGLGRVAGEGLAVERQEAECRALVSKTADMQVVDVLADQSISAYSGRDRPAYAELLRRIEKDELDVVVAWHPDRLHRSPAELEEYIAACDLRSVPTLTVQAGLWDLSTSSGRMVARQIGAVARYESEQKRDRILAEQRQAAQMGKRHGGGRYRPFGWERAYNGRDRCTYPLHPVEAPLLADAIARVLAKESLGSIISEWNRNGITTTGGRPWTYSLLRAVLLRPSNAGLVTRTGSKGTREEFTGDWEPVVTLEEHRALVSVLTDPARRTSPTWEPRYLCSGIARCGRCDSVLRSAVVVGRSNGGRRYKVYRCGNKSAAGTCGLMVKMDILDEVVRNAVVREYLLGTPTVPERARADSMAITALRTELAEIIRRKKQLLRLLAEEAYTESEVLEESRALNARRDHLEERIQHHVAQNAHVAMIEQARHALDSYWPKGVAGWTVDEVFNGPQPFEEADHHRQTVMGERFDSLSLTQRRVLVESLLSVVVAPGRGPERVSVRRKAA
jgi:site-specific DNA recombinase